MIIGFFYINSYLLFQFFFLLSIYKKVVIDPHSNILFLQFLLSYSPLLRTIDKLLFLYLISSSELYQNFKKISTKFILLKAIRKVFTRTFYPY